MTKKPPKRAKPPRRVLTETERMIRDLERRIERADTQEHAIRKEAQEQIQKIDRRRRRDQVMLGALKKQQAEGAI